MNPLTLRCPPGSRSPFATLIRTFAVLPLILLLQGSQFAGSTHDHPDERAAGHCSVCLHAHAPAVETAGQPAIARPTLDVECPHLAPAEIPAGHAPRFAATRAPPPA